MPAAERQELLREGRGPLARPLDLLHQPPVRVVVGQTAEEDVAVPGDDGHQVVEVVGHPAGQLADGLQPLGLPHPLFQPPPLGHVDGVADHPPRLPPPVPEEGERGVDMGLLPALPQYRPFPLVAPSRPHRGEGLLEPRPRGPGRVEKFDVSAQNLSGGVPEQPFGPLVPAGHAAPQVGGDHGVVNLVDDRGLIAEEQFGPADPEQGLHLAEQHPRVGRLGQVHVAAALQPPGLVLVPGEVAGQEDDRHQARRRVGLDPPADLDAAQVREADVEDHQVGVPGQAEGLRPGRGLQDAVTFGREDEGDGEAVVLVVIHAEDGKRRLVRHGSPSPGPLRCGGGGGELSECG